MRELKEQQELQDQVVQQELKELKVHKELQVH